MADTFSHSYMRMRMILFCCIMTLVTVAGGWMLVINQAEAHRIAQFSVAIEKAISATADLLKTQNHLSVLTDANLDLKNQNREIDTNITRAAFGGNSYTQKLYVSLQKKKLELASSLAKQKAAIAKERGNFSENFNALRGLFVALQASSGVAVKDSEMLAMGKMIDQAKSTDDQRSLIKSIEIVGNQKMPQSIVALWSNPNETNTLSSNIAHTLELATQLPALESYSGKSGIEITTEFEKFAVEKVQPQLNAVAAKLSEEADKTYADQRQSLLFTGFAMLALLLGAALFIILPLLRKVGQAQVDLTAANAELHEAVLVSQNAEKAKSEFLANMSHEIRTPMNGVLGMAELLGKSDMDGRQRKFVDVIIKSGNALLKIINDILDFSKIDAGQMSLDIAPFHLLEALEDVATLMSARVSEKDLELIVRVDPALPDMYQGDIGRFRQILTNLIGNAVKFTEKGHVLVNISGEVENGAAYLSVAVTDTGIGIPEDKLASVFQQFSQVDASSTRRHEGTGLGLAIASRLVNLMHGTIKVESTIGVGTVFTATMTLPVYEGAKKVDKQLPTDLNGARVLVVDDNPVNREILQEQLGAWGFDSAATDGAVVAKAFLDKAISVGITVDCLILDYHMPDVNGAMLAQELFDDPRFRAIPKILLSSVDQIDHGILMKAGILNAWLTKPASSKQLRETIIELIHDARVKAGTHVTGLQNLANLMRQSPSAILVKPVVQAPTIEAQIFQTPPIAQIEIEQTAAATAPSNFAQIQMQAAPIATSSSPFILVAEDNEVNQFVVMQILEGLNIDHEVKSNGRLAVDAWKQRKPTLILMDVSMPEMNGLIATQTIRELEKGTGLHTPIIGLTAHALKGDEERCLAAGMDAYLTKPISATKLEEQIAKYAKISGSKAA